MRSPSVRNASSVPTPGDSTAFRTLFDTATAATLEVLEATRELGVLIGKGGLNGNVLRIKPPLCITTADVDFALDVLDRALARAAAT